jgi:hypothetical protein
LIPLNRLSSAAIFFVLLSAGGCAHRPLMTYRLVRTDASQILIPPRVAKLDLAVRTFSTDVGAVSGKCPSLSGSSPSPITIQTKRKRVQVTVTKELLLRQPTGWLSEWTAGLESQGCIAAGAGPKLADEIATALPLDMNQAVRLLYSNQLEIAPNMRIQVVSPILKEGATLNDPILIEETTGKGNSLGVVIKSTANLLGYETAMYTVQPKAGGMGASIAPLYADRHIGDETERRPEPAVNYFRFPANAAFFRVFYEAEQTEYAALVIAAPTRSELERRTKILEAGAASCEKLNNELCVAVPKQVAINGLIPVTVNGSQIWLTWGTSVGGAVRATGYPDANRVLPKLAVYKPYHSKLAAVEFDRASPAILNLTVTGGEVISWK